MDQRLQQRIRDVESGLDSDYWGLANELARAGLAEAAVRAYMTCLQGEVNSLARYIKNVIATADLHVKDPSLAARLRNSAAMRSATVRHSPLLEELRYLQTPHLHPGSKVRVRQHRGRELPLYVTGSRRAGKRSIRVPPGTECTLVCVRDNLSRSVASRNPGGVEDRFQSCCLEAELGQFYAGPEDIEPVCPWKALVYAKQRLEKLRLAREEILVGVRVSGRDKKGKLCEGEVFWVRDDRCGFLPDGVTARAHPDSAIWADLLDVRSVSDMDKAP